MLPSTPESIHFFGLERLIDSLRGMELEDPDDAPERAQLEALLSDDRISTFGRLLLAMLHFRAGRFEEAASVLVPAPEDETYGVATAVLTGAALSRAGRHDEAWRALKPSADARTLDTLTEAAPKNDHVGPTFLAAARANALWMAGERALAVKLAEAAAALPEAPNTRWQELAQYAAAQGQWPAVVSALAQVKADDLYHLSHYTLALAHRALGDEQAALDALRAAIQYDRALRQIASADPRLAGLPGLDALTADLNPDLSWLRRRKDIAHLLASEGLRNAGVRWVGEATSKAQTAEICGRYKKKTYPRGLLWSVAWWKACGALARGKTLVAELPEAHKRAMGARAGAIFHDKKDPNHLYFTPSPEIPAGLWIRVVATEDALLAALGWWYPIRRVPRLELPCCVRAWAGNMRSLVVPNPYSGELEAAGTHEISRFWVSSPVVDMLGWGSAYDDDPWPNVVRLGGGGGIGMTVKMREYGQDREGALPQLNHRTHFSRSQLRLEVHPDGMYIWEIRYRPSPFAEPIARFNEQCGYKLPLDLPIDVAAALFGFEFGTMAWLQACLDDPEYADRLYPLVTMAAGVGYGDLRTSALLRRFARHPSRDAAAAAINAMIRYNLPFLLAEAGTLPLPPEFLSVIAARVDEGIGPPLAQLEPYDDEDEDVDEEDE